MSECDTEIECGTHGRAYAAYLCKHLLEDPQQEWICDYPSDESPWPDAWCQACDRAFQECGEWNEKNEHVLGARVICHLCYEAFKGSSVAPLMALRAEAWQPLVSEAVSDLRAKQDNLDERFDLYKHERYDLDLENGEIVFSNAGRPALTARVQLVGSVSTVSDTWLWSWANNHVSASVSDEMLAVRAFGERQRFASLTVPKWPGEEVDGWEMTAVAAKILDAPGAYRTPGESGFGFLLFMDITRAR
jgi:hypothetical protein